ncbi:MAG: hypothetical protein Q9162_004037 [Coniocarpon cinnabarinum]
MSTADHLPHLDPPPTAAEISAAEALIATERSHSVPSESSLHPQITANYPEISRTSSLASNYHAAIAANNGKPPPSAIDTSRYEAPDAPADSDRDAWKATLRRAYTSSAYLGGREDNLKMLEENGKNAWLIANFGVEETLRGLKRSLKEMKATGVSVDEERRLRQEGARGEIEGSEEGWRKALGRAVEVEVAGAKLKAEVEEKRRDGRDG